MKAFLSEVVQGLAPAALVDVFASYGVRVVPQKEDAKVPSRFPQGASIVPVEAGEAMVAGVVGFTGAMMRGTLLLATAFDVIASVRPAELRQHRILSKDSYSDWILVRDWSGELANQILGRMKNRLHRHGVTFDVSPPTALSGAALTFAAPKGPSPQSHVFASGSHKIHFCFDAIFNPGQRVSGEGPEDEAAEGKVILFD